MIKKLTYLYISVKVKFRVFVQVNNNIKRFPNSRECSWKISLEGGQSFGELLWFAVHSL